MTTATVPVPQITPPVSLATAQFHTLADIPPELEWFANLPNPNTRRAYRQDIKDFMPFASLRQPEQLREITSQGLANDTIRREELCKLNVDDVQQRQGVPYLRIEGKGDNDRYIDPPSRPCG
jgi:site-specific recombinase XerD